MKPSARLLSACVIALAVCFAGAAHAGDLVVRAQKYAAERQLPTKTLTVGPANRKVTRLFMPVTPDKYNEFVDTFGQKGGGVVFRYQQTNAHIAMAFKPGDAYFWARNRGGWAGFEQFTSHAGGGHLMAVDLDASELQHLQSWLAARAVAGDQLYNAGNCMEWFSNAEVGPGKPMFHALGITRSKDGPNMKAKLLHVANQKLAVVGVPVNNMAEFTALTEEQLLGKPPAGGIEDAAK